MPYPSYGTAFTSWGFEMAARLKLGNQVVRGGLEELSDARASLAELAYEELKEEAPVDSGALRSSIRRGRGKRLAYFTQKHGVIIDAKGKHRGWVDRAMSRAIAEFERGN